MTRPIGVAEYRVTAAGRRFSEARQYREDARDQLRAEVLSALAAGMSEVEAARIAGVSRTTVRAWRKADETQ